MLTSLHIKNYALIEKLEVDFSSGFSVITGETGTGKSVLLGAIGMLLGERSDAKLVREGADKCIIEGCFDISSLALEEFFEENELEYDAAECIVRRELSATGRGRFFVNDTPVSAALLKELGNKLIDIHSQHKNLLLGNKNYQLNILDVLAGNNEILAEYSSLFRSYENNRKELIRAKEELEAVRNDEEWLRFQLEEIESAAFQNGEQEELEQESVQLAHAEDIQAALYNAVTLLDNDEKNMLQALREASASMEKISRHYPAANNLAERMESSYIELKDCCEELRRSLDGNSFSPARLEQVENRLTLMYDLFKKHRVANIGELNTLAEEYRTRLEQITDGDDRIESLEKESARLCKELDALCAKITELRRSAALALQEKITTILVSLGMPMIRFEVDFSVAEQFTATGRDAVKFLFSANSISPLQPLADVASGGEMARVMLALKSIIAEFIEMPTLIFDEIDTGVSGALAERMGRLMQQIGGMNRQVISITHLPQVAALGSEHYKVYKEEGEGGTRTKITRLATQERVKEIAQMMSGEQMTDSAMETARNLIMQK
ncbi:MAG: DNA repair protein RecN [Bacteroidaceae bacterium]|nr:DNA repair protein RecN [Bacteroidaceae bacterium]